MSLESKLSELQNKFAHRDLLTEPGRTAPRGFTEILVAKKLPIKIKLYQEKGHSLPHVHIDYGQHHHVATYSIESASRIDGNLSRKYDRLVEAWLRKNHDKLLELWEAVQAGEPHVALQAELDGDV